MNHYKWNITVHGLHIIWNLLAFTSLFRFIGSEKQNRSYLFCIMITHHEIVIGHINKEYKLFISPNLSSLSLSFLCTENEIANFSSYFEILQRLPIFWLILVIIISISIIDYEYWKCYRYEISSVPLFQNSKLNLHVLKDGQFFNIYECFSFYW